jgi:hypothetical protein
MDTVKANFGLFPNPFPVSMATHSASRFSSSNQALLKVTFLLLLLCVFFSSSSLLLFRPVIFVPLVLFRSRPVFSLLFQKPTYFELLGRLLGQALLEKKLLDLPLSPAFFFTLQYYLPDRNVLRTLNESSTSPSSNSREDASASLIPSNLCSTNVSVPAILDALTEIDPEIARSLRRFLRIAQRKDFIFYKHFLSSSEAAESVDSLQLPSSPTSPQSPSSRSPSLTSTPVSQHSSSSSSSSSNLKEEKDVSMTSPSSLFSFSLCCPFFRLAFFV